MLLAFRTSNTRDSPAPKICPIPNAVAPQLRYTDSNGNPSGPHVVWSGSTWVWG